MFWSRTRSTLDRNDEDWQIACWGWLNRNLGPLESAKAETIDCDRFILPTREFFPPTTAKGHAFAEHVFDTVKRHCGIATWPCQLVPQAQMPEIVLSPYVHAVPPTDPLGTFGIDDELVRISYQPELVENPSGLVATFAHELAHYVLSSVDETPPGGPENLEFATDLATIYLGFGVFGANTAFNFSQFSDPFAQGWRSQRNGYLSEHEWCFGLAVFSELSETGTNFLSHLKPHLAKVVTKNRNYLHANPSLLEVIIRSAENTVEAVD